MVEMRLSCNALYERLVVYLPCQCWLWPVSLEDLEEPILQPPVQLLSECWVPPRAHPFESSSSQMSQAWPPCHLQTTGRSTGSWDIGAAHADGFSTPTSQAPVSSRQQSGTSAGMHDVQDASQGIELRPAKTNVLLGQYHMERSGQFVSVKPGRGFGSDKPRNSKWGTQLEDRGPVNRLHI